MPSPRRTRIVKVGGSLLRQPEGPAKIRAWCAEQTRADEWWMAGGGEAADLVRQWDRRFGLPQEIAYHLTLHSLTLTQTLLQSLLDLPLHSCLNLLEEVRAFPASWHRDYGLATWDATSDTLAALIARRRHVAELVLLKAAPLPTELGTWAELAEKGIVDPVFARAAKGIPRVRIESPGPRERDGSGFSRV